MSLTTYEKEFLNKVVLPRLIEMAIDGSLPSDMNELGYDVFEVPASKYHAQENYITGESVVTHLQVFPLKEAMGKTVAFARVVLNNDIQLTGLRVVQGVHGLFVQYPRDEFYKGDDYRSIYYPLSKALRDQVETKVLALYNEQIKNR